MSNTEVAPGDSKENSIDVERHINFIKQLVRDRDEAEQAINNAKKQLEHAEQALLDAEESLSKAEDALHDAREKLKDYLCDEGVL